MKKNCYPYWPGCLVSLFILAAGCSRIPEIRGPVNPVPFTAVTLTDSFWAPRIRLNHEVTIPIAFKQSEETGRIKNFEVAGGLTKGTFCTIYPFDDSDVFKLIEGASYTLQTTPDPRLEAYLDTVIYKIGKAQEPDGYLYTNRTILGLKAHPWAGTERWVNDHVLSHELYNLGHLFEAATAHFQATGKRTLLDIAIKAANLVIKDMNWNALVTYPGHQEIEIGLVKLYRITGDKRFLDEAKFFLDARGPKGEAYNQANFRVVDQTEAEGHAVRATYMYSAMADVAGLLGDTAYIKAIDLIWDDIVTKKVYVTGGIGASGGNEGFAGPYNLPNMSAYCETCASIGFVLFNQRLFLAHGDAKYFDVLERTLYNALLSGVSLSGDHFFYPNPLESFGQHSRSEWFGCACCPSNICRFIPSLPGYVYATGANAVYVNLYASNTAIIPFDSSIIKIEQTTGYPWNGKVNITLNPNVEKQFALMLRIPGWSRNEAIPGGLYHFVRNIKGKISLTVNGSSQKLIIQNGYAIVWRKWHPGDQVSLNLPMPVREVAADEKVSADQGKRSFQRGPIVFCAEFPDNRDGHVLNLLFNENAITHTEFKPNLLNGVELIHTLASPVSWNKDARVVLGTADTASLIPYYAWSNRGSGEMMVWLPVTRASTRPLPIPTIASQSSVSSSKPTKGLTAVNDQYEPLNSMDESWAYYHFWPDSNQWEWIQYDFAAPVLVSHSKVYWFDDGPEGGCRIPDTWELLYADRGIWKPVKTDHPYILVKDGWNEVSFLPVHTNALRLRIKLNRHFSSGVHEWIVQ